MCLVSDSWLFWWFMCVFGFWVFRLHKACVFVCFLGICRMINEKLKFCAYFFWDDIVGFSN